MAHTRPCLSRASVARPRPSSRAQGAQHIARVLARAPLIEDFRMASSRVGPKGGLALAQALAAGTRLVRLDISDNPMTEKVAPALAALVKSQPHLKVRPAAAATRVLWGEDLEMPLALGGWPRARSTRAGVGWGRPP